MYDEKDIIPNIAHMGMSVLNPKKESEMSSVFSILLLPNERTNPIVEAMPRAIQNIVA